MRLRCSTDAVLLGAGEGRGRQMLTGKMGGDMYRIEQWMAEALVDVIMHWEIKTKAIGGGVYNGVDT